jgi:hypothetical protein
VPYSGGDGLTGRVGETAAGYDSHAVSEGRHGVDLSLTWAPALCQNIKCSGRGSGSGSSEIVRASSEAESCPRGRPAVERGGVSPKGGVQPSSEAEFLPRGRPALERGGVSPEGASSPRARRSSVSMALCPSSEVEFRPRGAWADRSGGPLRLPGPWAPAIGP